MLPSGRDRIRTGPRWGTGRWESPPVVARYEGTPECGGDPMNTVSLSRTLDAPPTSVREAMSDHQAFLKAAEFDEVTVVDGTIQIANMVGILTIELTIELVDDPDAFLAYEQRDGIFDEMVTTYTVTPTDDGTEVTARTEFELDIALVGQVLDATIIQRQRRKELTAQFDWLETVCTA